MKIINHEETISRTVNHGRLVEVIGLGTMAMGMMFEGVNVKSGARVPVGSKIGYTMTEVGENKTKLTIRFNRPGKIYEKTYTVDLPFDVAAEYFELEDCDL